MAEKDYSLPFMSAEVAEDKKTVDILTGSPHNTQNPTTLNEYEEDYHIYYYPNTIQDKFTDRDYKNTNSDIAAMEQGLEQVEDYPILNDIEFQADLEKIISGNVLTQVGLRALMEKTGGNLSKVLQNYVNSSTMGEVESTGSPPDKTKEAPYDYNARYVDDKSNPLSLLNPKIRINFSDLADQDSALQTQWRKTKKDPTQDNLNSLKKLLNVSIYGNKNTPLSQANTISHELMHFAIIELYNKGLLDKATIEKLRENNSLSLTGDNEIEELFISKMTKEKDLENDPAYKGMYPSKAIFGDLKSKFNDPKLQNRIESAAEKWLKTYTPPVREYDSSGVLKAEEPKFKEEMYDGAIPAGLAKGGDIMPMEQQMQMFAIGGLDDDGLSRDPVSGNEIPPGSMANEVRDDVDARLSDGEYVVPANVVRFFGVKFFEDLRTQAMQGLGAMEANGRIGGEPVPSAMPMQDQMAEIQPDVSEEEMQMLQGLMNEGGYVSGYAIGGDVPKDVDLENPTPFNPSPFANVGSSFFSPYNTNLTPDPNAPIPVDPGPNPESGISFVTMVNPATGAIQVVQFMGGNPVDANAYNQLLSSGFFIQGGPELAQYKQKIEQDNRDSDKPPERDSAGRLITRPTPGDATIGELGQLIVESSGNFLTTLAGLTLTGKAAKAMASKTDNIMKVLNERISGTGKYAESTAAQMKAAQVLKDAYTGFKSGKLDKEGLAKSVSGIYKAPSFKNAIGSKRGKYGSENWFGYISDDEIEKQFGGGVTTTSKPFVDKKNKDVTPTGGAIIKPSSGDSPTLSSIPTFLQPDNDNDNNNDQGGSGGGPSGPTATQGGGMTGSDDRPDDPRGEGQYGGGSNSQPSSSSSNNTSNNTSNNNSYEAQEDPNYGLMNKGGIVKKRKKKTKKY